MGKVEVKLQAFLTAAWDWSHWSLPSLGRVYPQKFSPVPNVYLNFEEFPALTKGRTQSHLRFIWLATKEFKVCLLTHTQKLTDIAPLQWHLASLHHCVQTGPLVGTLGSFSGHKATGMWNWPLTSIYYWSLKCVELYLHPTMTWGLAKYRMSSCHGTFLSTGTNLLSPFLRFPKMEISSIFKIFHFQS